MGLIVCMNGLARVPVVFLGFKVLWNAKGFALRPPHISTCPALSWFQSHGTSCLFHPNSTIDMNHHRHDYNDDESVKLVAASESVGDGQWAMQVIERILERAFRQPPKFSTLDRYLTHQHILLETDVDEAGNAPETVKEDCFPGNPDPPHCFSLEGTISATKKRPPKGWSCWDSTLEMERQLYIMTDSLTKRLNAQQWNQGRGVPVFRDERLKSYPKLVRDDISQQEMHLSFTQEIV